MTIPTHAELLDELQRLARIRLEAFDARKPETVASTELRVSAVLQERVALNRLAAMETIEL